MAVTAVRPWPPNILTSDPTARLALRTLTSHFHFGVQVGIAKPPAFPILDYSCNAHRSFADNLLQDS